MSREASHQESIEVRLGRIRDDGVQCSEAVCGRQDGVSAALDSGWCCRGCCKAMNCHVGWECVGDTSKTGFSHGSGRVRVDEEDRDGAGR